MHDLKYSNEILAALKKSAVAKDKTGNIVVNVKLSPFSHVRPEGLNETFKFLAGEYGYANVILNVEIGEFVMHCKDCGRKSKHKEPVFTCPHCNGCDFDIVKGEEFCIDSIESK